MKSLRQKFGIDEDHTHVREGFPEEVIPEVAKEIEAELVILGTVGRTGLSAALLGNTAEHVISKLSCNLLAIKPSKKISKFILSFKISAVRKTIVLMTALFC